MKSNRIRLPPNTQMRGFSWRGGTRPPRSNKTDSRDQPEEPPAEYWEEKYSEGPEENNEDNSNQEEEKEEEA